MTQSIEFHFQEGFSGETVEMCVGGEVLTRFEAKTRFQIGLATIETLSLKPRQRVIIRIKSLDLIKSVRPKSGIRFVTVNLVDGALVVKQTATSPGYV